MSIATTNYIHSYYWVEGLDGKGVWKHYTGQYTPMGTEAAARQALAYSQCPAGDTKAASASAYVYTPSRGWEWLGTTIIVVYAWSTGAETEKVMHRYGGAIVESVTTHNR